MMAHRLTSRVQISGNRWENSVTVIPGHLKILSNSDMVARNLYIPVIGKNTLVVLVGIEFGVDDE